MNLYAANHQWRTRPADERFSTVGDLIQAAQEVRERSEECETAFGRLRAIAKRGEVLLETGEGGAAQPTTWAFEQLVRRFDAPPDYLQRLPASLVARLVNHGISKRRETPLKYLLLHAADAHQPPAPGQPTTQARLRAFTGFTYARLWDVEIATRLSTFEEQGWRVPPARPAFSKQPGARPATEADVLHAGHFDLSVKVGDLIAPAGLFLGDRSFFAFMIREDRRIRDGTAAGLSRGFFVWNSEVGYSSFGASIFLFRHVCGNHIVWDVAGVEEIRVRHVEKNLDRAIDALIKKVGGYADASATEEEHRIAAAKARVLGQNVKEVVDNVLEWNLPAMTRERAMKAWGLAVRNRDTDGPPTTAWGFAQGVTRLAQTFPFTEARVALERSAGRILMLATP